MKHSLFTGVLVFSAVCVLNAAEKEIYAHYMGCFCASSGSLQHHQEQQSKGLTWRNPKGAGAALGGRFINWPLLPQDQDTKITVEQGMELDIRRAIRAGFDGFAIDAWAGTSPKFVEQMIRTCERMKVKFGITICFDPSCQPKDKDNLTNFINTANSVLKFKDSPNVARRNGKVLFFTYHAKGIIKGMKLPAVPDGPERWKQIGDAWNTLRKEVKEPIFIHYCVGASYHANRKDRMLERYIEWAGQNFDAVGDFTGAWIPAGDEIAKSVKKGGAEWSQPLIYQYDNKGGGITCGKGLDVLRTNWNAAIKSDSTLIQFVTWNDYGEETSLAPSYPNGYTITRVNKYYVDLWKTGKAPVIEKDEIHFVYRRFTDDAKLFPLYARCRMPGVLEVVTFLKEPGIVSVEGYEDYEAPAGMNCKQFPLKPGKLSAKIKRGLFKLTALEYTAPEVISDYQWREDLTLGASGSNYAEEWKLDFGETKPFLYSENGDIDGDGLPNWFEMLYFGKFPFFSTATAAKPDDDPDKDGFTNLQEYQNCTDPLRAEVPYKAGEVWDFFEPFAKQTLVYQPIRDIHDKEVWFMLYKFGPNGAVPLDGKYSIAKRLNPSAKYYGTEIIKHPEYGHGLEVGLNKDGKSFNWGVRRGCSMILGWKSPVNGTVSVKGIFGACKGHGHIEVYLMKNQEKLNMWKIEPQKEQEIKAENIPVKKGDFIYMIPHGKHVWGLAGELKGYKVTLISGPEDERDATAKK